MPNAPKEQNPLHQSAGVRKTFRSSAGFDFLWISVHFTASPAPAPPRPAVTQSRLQLNDVRPGTDPRTAGGVVCHPYASEPGGAEGPRDGRKLKATVHFQTTWLFFLVGKLINYLESNISLFASEKGSASLIEPGWRHNSQTRTNTHQYCGGSSHCPQRMESSSFALLIKGSVFSRSAPVHLAENNDLFPPHHWTSSISLDSKECLHG